MKFWFLTRTMFNYSNYHRTFFSNTLYPPRRPSLLFCCSYSPRCELWMTIKIYSCKWRLNIFYLHIYPYCPWALLWLILLTRNLNYWRSITFINHSNCIYRLCSSMRTNKILGGYCYYKSVFSYSLHRYPPCSMNVRRLCCWKCYFKSIFRTSLLLTIRDCSLFCLTPLVFTSDRLQKPTRSLHSRAKSPISPLLHL